LTGLVSFPDRRALGNELLLFNVFGPIDLAAGEPLIENVQGRTGRTGAIVRLMLSVRFCAVLTAASAMRLMFVVH
jgi:hypothetical protein